MSEVILRGGPMDGKVLPEPLPHTFVYDVGAEYGKGIYEPTDETDEQGRRIYRHVGEHPTRKQHWSEDA